MSVFYALRRGRHGSSLMYFLSRLSRQYGAAWWLALALCLAPTWGHIHRVLHLPHALGWAERVEGRLGALLASHSPADCELLDQLSHAGPVSEPCTHAPSVPASVWQASPPTQPLRAASPLPFQARAPPLVLTENS